jgi:hypothetical protein
VSYTDLQLRQMAEVMSNAHWEENYARLKKLLAAPSPTLREKQLRELAEKWRHDFSSPCCSLEYGHYPKECKRCQVEELLGLPLSLPKGLGTSEASVLATLAQGDGK